MKGTRHSEEQIIAILKQGEAGLSTAELCRQHGKELALLTSLVHSECSAIAPTVAATAI
jgi:hypothetical protein